MCNPDDLDLVAISKLYTSHMHQEKIIEDHLHMEIVMVKETNFELFYTYFAISRAGIGRVAISPLPEGPGGGHFTHHNKSSSGPTRQNINQF